MRNYISLALATTPSGLGSHCKHVGAPTRLRIGNRLRTKCSAVAWGRGRADKRRGEQGTIFQCSCKNAKPIFFQSVEKRQRGRAGCIARLWRKSRRMQWAIPLFERSSGSRYTAQCRRAGFITALPRSRLEDDSVLLARRRLFCRGVSGPALGPPIGIPNSPILSGRDKRGP